MRARQPRTVVALALGLALATAGAACGDDDTAAPAATDLVESSSTTDAEATTTGAPASTAPSTTVPVTSVPPVGPGPDGAPGDISVARYLEPEEGLVESTAAPVIGVVGTEDPARVLVTFWSGTAECYGVDRVDVEETDTEIRLEVVVGRRPPADTACIAIAEQHATAVDLAAPLGDRRVVDLSAGAAMPDDPVGYASAAFEAWATGDRVRLGRLVADEALTVLTGRPWSEADEWSPEPSCEGAAGSTYCTWSGAEEELVLRVADEAAAQGTDGAVIEASFSTSA